MSKLPTGEERIKLAEMLTDKKCYIPTSDEIVKVCRVIRNDGYTDKRGYYHAPWSKTVMKERNQFHLEPLELFIPDKPTISRRGRCGKE